MNKMKSVALIVAGLALGGLTACSEPGEVRTYEEEGYTNYTETKVGKAIYELRFTDTEGIKWKCFAMQAGYAGGLDGCEKVK